MTAENEPRKELGIIGVYGGLGPAATDRLLTQITRNTPAGGRDQAHPRRVVIYRPDTPDRTAYLLGKGPDPRPIMRETLQQIEEDGATCVGVPCNTAHAILPDLEGDIKIPIINMLDLTVSYIKNIFPDKKRVGLLATDGTIETGIYERLLTKNGLDIVIPDAETQKQVMQGIYGTGGIKDLSKRTDKAHTLFKGAADHLAEHGAEVIIMGCTEIPIGIEDGEAAVPLIDPSEQLARGLVDAAMH